MGVTSFLLVSCLGLSITAQVLACNAPPSISYGTYSPVSNNYLDGDIVQYRCENGYTLHGSKTITCSRYGTFQPAAPTCVSDGSSTQSSSTWIIAVVVPVCIVCVVVVVAVIFQVKRRCF